MFITLDCVFCHILFSLLPPFSSFSALISVHFTPVEVKVRTDKHRLIYISTASSQLHRPRRGCGRGSILNQAHAESKSGKGRGIRSKSAPPHGSPFICKFAEGHPRHIPSFCGIKTEFVVGPVFANCKHRVLLPPKGHQAATKRNSVLCESELRGEVRREEPPQTCQIVLGVSLGGSRLCQRLRCCSGRLGHRCWSHRPPPCLSLLSDSPHVNGSFVRCRCQPRDALIERNGRY
mmetsp:Transcript_28470/g.55756  ORF Transcript_28470/g.55756 Transcript_28470/m.55756 type:complete len:234 (+) Transcript_28470:109-810(+)